MKFTLSWLKRFLDTDAKLEEIANRLTMIGLEVEEIIDHSAGLANFTVAEITETIKHPEADKLQICKVATGKNNEILQIVCGASNARKGIKVALAKVGSIIPNGNFKIKDSTIRGVSSAGMLCSAEELNLAESSEGIMELPENAIIGEPITKILGLDDPVFHINITPNRADALGVYGIARDLAASGFGARIVDLDPKISDEPVENISIIQCFKEQHNAENVNKSDFNIKVNAPESCPLFSCLVIDNIDINIKSPTWLQNNLNNIGITPKSPIIDITNYISYSFGQPMHAYDASKISGDLTVELLKEKTKFQALNDKEYELEPGDLIIRDENKIQCLAGIIGGVQSACDEHSTKIILEAASFAPDYIIQTGRRLALNTDSRYRFERGVDQNFTYMALSFAAGLIKEICGGEFIDEIIIGENQKPLRTLAFPINFLQRKTGIELAPDIICDILKSLGFICELSEQIINLTIPSWRQDISICEDIVEEIVRIHGYDKIPEIPLPITNSTYILPKEQKRYSDIKRLLAVNGYTELVTWSFMDSNKAMLFSKLKEELYLANPISSELDYMRPSILPNLLQIIHNNKARGFKDLSLFEVGPIFPHDKPETVNSLAAVRIGMNFPKNIHETPRNFDIFDMKADLETVLNYAGLAIDKCQIKYDAIPEYYHPTRSASLNLGKNVIAYFGQIHPLILKTFDIENDVIAFEIQVHNLPIPKNKYGKKANYISSDYQAVYRDYAFIIDKDQEVGDILNQVRNSNKKLIKSVDLFDIYTGNKIESNKKSIALSVQIQDNSKTLEENDIQQVTQEIVNIITNKFKGQIRS